MALLFTEGFDEYDSSYNGFSAALLGSYANDNCGWVYTDKATTSGMYSWTKYVRTNSGGGGKSLYNDGAVVSLLLPNGITEVVVGFAVYWSALTAASNFCYFSQNVNSAASNPSEGISFKRLIDGALEIIDAKTGSSLYVSATATLPMNTWNYIEIRYKFGASGDIQVRLNGADLTNLSGIDTRGGSSKVKFFSLRAYNSGAEAAFDDMYVCDTTGSVNNTFLGPIGVYTLTPNVDGSVQMTASSGSNYGCVNSVPYTGTKYVTAGSTGLTDFYGATDLPAITPSAIAGVMVVGRSMKPEHNTSGIQLGVKTSGVSSFGSSKNVPVGTWVGNFSIFETPPSGGSWTKAVVDGMEIGIKSV